MNILVIGCGKVGSNLATRLSAEGHDVSVVDNNARNFLQLGPEFKGLTLEGFECDQEVLMNAGIAACDVVAAVSHDDNINIMVAQIASTVFRVRRVITRIYDPEREEVYCNFGLQTICPTRLTVDAVYSAALEAEMTHKTMHFGLSTISFASENVEQADVGKSVAQLSEEFMEQGILLFGIMHSSGDLTMATEHPERRIGQSDRIIAVHKVD